MKGISILLLLTCFFFLADGSILNDRLSTEIQAHEAQIITYALASLGVLLGFVICFWGYRLFKPTLFIVGFIVGAGVTYYVLYFKTQVGLIMLISIPLLAGVLLGLVLIIFAIVGIFAVGAVGAFLLVCVVFSSYHGGLIPSKMIGYIVMGVVVLIGGCVAVLLQKQVIIIATSFAGSYAVIAGIDHFVHGGFSGVIPNIIAYRTEDIQCDYRTYIEIASCFVLFAIGVFVQFKHTGKNYYHKHTHEEDGYHALNSLNS